MSCGSLRRRPVVEADHDVGVHETAAHADAGQAARLRLEHDEAERLADAGMNEEIGGVIIIGELRVVLDVGAPGQRAGAMARGGQDAAQRAVADDDEMVGVGMPRMQRLEGGEQHLDVLFRRKAARRRAALSCRAAGRVPRAASSSRGTGRKALVSTPRFSVTVFVTPQPCRSCRRCSEGTSVAVKWL